MFIHNAKFDMFIRRKDYEAEKRRCEAEDGKLEPKTQQCKKAENP